MTELPNESKAATTPLRKELSEVVWASNKSASWLNHVSQVRVGRGRSEPLGYW